MVKIASFPPDILRHIVSFLEGKQIGNLYLSGDNVIRQKLSMPNIVEFVKIDFYGLRNDWPLLLSNFPTIESITLKCHTIPNYSILQNVRLDSIPKSVKHLQFLFANGFSCLLEHDPDASDVDGYNADGYRLRDLSNIFPQLLTFEFVSGVNHWPLNNHRLLSCLPRTLLSIKLPKKYQLDPREINYLPQSLESLSLTLQYPHDDCEDVEFPPHLTQLEIEPILSLSLLEKLPTTITSLCFTFEGLDGNSLGEECPKLPQALTHLRLTTGSITSHFLTNLPTTLRNLALTLVQFEMRLITALPPNLEIFNYYGNEPDNCDDLLPYSWHILPRQLKSTSSNIIEHLSTVWLHSADWTHVPRSLSNFVLRRHSFNSEHVTSLPTSITELMVTDQSSDFAELFIAPCPWHNTLRSLSILVGSIHPSLPTWIHEVSTLEIADIEFTLTAPDNDLGNQFYNLLPISLTHLHSNINCDFEAINLSRLTRLKLLNLSSPELTPCGLAVYSNLPASLLELYYEFLELPLTGIDKLPRGITNMTLLTLPSELDDQALASLPPHLRYCFIGTEGTTNYTVGGLRLLSTRLEVLWLPQSRLLNQMELNQFAESRPCLDIKISHSIPNCFDSAYNRYIQSHLTLGRMTARYG